MKFFLDIDGVMVHAIPHRSIELESDGFYKFNIKSVEILNVALHLYKENEIILSSSHRFRFSASEWKELFKRRGVIVNYLSVINLPLEYQTSRKTEILKWIEICGLMSENILIIDDDKSLNELPEELKHRLVLTNPYTGLIDSTEINRILNTPKTKARFN